MERFFQITQAKKFKKIIIQRSLFPLYPDYKSPFLEKKLRKINTNITIDIWDPIHIWKPELTYSTLILLIKFQLMSLN